ncbi:MAG: MoxR family ATPase [Gammaproteobacteria bacterium]|nr:MoxR family ATPase [Gammaproteobacteria bacterium]
MNDATTQSDSAQALKALYRNLNQVILGKSQSVLLLLTSLLAEGHLLIEDAPGLGKTTLAKALARSLGLEFGRVQCTPDLMPSDITGINVFDQSQRAFKFLPGPVFCQILLADEINRATPRTQSALLEAMAERTVTVDRETHVLSNPFFVIATQNPLEYAGTYPLPEAQLDRFFMRIGLGYPTHETETALLTANMHDEPLQQVTAVMSAEELLQLQQRVKNIAISEPMLSYIARIVQATRQHERVTIGASPRGSLALMNGARALAFLKGDKHVTPEHVRSLVIPVLGHRIQLKDSRPGSHASGVFLTKLLDNVALPDFPQATESADGIV